MVENRRVGIKSGRSTSAPARSRSSLAHADLEDLTLERDVHHEKARLEPRWAELVYDGMWFSPLKEALDAFFDETQRHVTGEVRLRVSTPGSCVVDGRRSPVALYDHGLATYDAADTFRHADAEGFVRLWGLGVQTWAARQGVGDGPDVRRRVVTLGRVGSATGPPTTSSPSPRACSFDRRLWRVTTSPARGPTSRGLVRRGGRSPRPRRRRIARGARRRRATELAAGTFVFAADRRGHPHRRSSAG